MVLFAMLMTYIIFASGVNGASAVDVDVAPASRPKASVRGGGHGVQHQVTAAAEDLNRALDVVGKPGQPVFSSSSHVPVIGILATPSVASTTKLNNETGEQEEVDYYTYIAASYVSWLEAAGARAIVIPYYATSEKDQEEIATIFSQINGLLLPGGEDYRDMPNSSAPQLVKLAKEANDRGDHFPVWGTCLGFEYLVMLASSNDAYDETHDILDTNYDAWNMSLALDYTPEAANSTMYAEPNMRQMAQNLPLSMNMHHNGVTPEAFAENNLLSSMYKILSTNVDRRGRPFVSSMEAREYPFFGTQYHPEKNQFEYMTYPNSMVPYEAINHSPEGVAFSMHTSQVFVNEALKNTHTLREADAHRYPSLWTYENRIHVGGFQQIFIISNHTTTTSSKKEGALALPISLPIVILVGIPTLILGLSVLAATIWAMVKHSMCCCNKRGGEADATQQHLNEPLLDEVREDNRNKDEQPVIVAV